MPSDWLHRIAPYPRPSAAEVSEERTFTGRSWHSEGWLEPKRVIYDHQLVLFKKGEFRVQIADKVYFCREGTFLIIPPGCWESTWQSGTGRGHRSWCHFDWVYQGPWGRTPIMTYAPAKPRLSQLRLPPAFVPPVPIQGEIPSPRTAFDLFERLLQRQIFGNAHEQLASRSVLLELLLHLLDKEKMRAPAGRAVHLAESVRLQLKAVVDSGTPLISVQQMLEKTRYSYAHLCRIFRTEYGISPMKYINALRIDQAKLLLRDTTLSVAEVAYQVGYNDPGYFSRIFRKLAGRSPLQYYGDDEAGTGKQE